MQRIRIISLFALVIIIFAAIGLIFCGVGLYYVKTIKVPQLSTTQVFTSVQQSLGSVSVLIEDSSVAMGNVSGTVDEAKDSLKEASGMLSESSEDLEEIAGSIDFEIFGIRPLGDVSKYFLSISNDLESLSENMEQLADSVGVNVKDIENISDDLYEISRNIDDFSLNIEKTTSTVPDFGIKTVAYVIIIFMLLQNIIILLVGISLHALNNKKTPDGK